MNVFKKFLYSVLKVQPVSVIEAAYKNAEKMAEARYLARQNRLKSELESLREIMYREMHPANLSWSEIVCIKEHDNLLLFGLIAEMYVNGDLGSSLPSDSAITLYRPFSSNKIGFLYFEVRPNTKDVFLIDLWVEQQYRKKGLGSKMLQVLTSLSLKTNMEKIIGELSPVDYQQRKEQINFYKKNGFIIVNPGTERTTGKIVKNISANK